MNNKGGFQERKLGPQGCRCTPLSQESWGRALRAHLGGGGRGVHLAPASEFPHVTSSHRSNQGPAYGPESPGPPPWQPAGLPVPECLLDGSVSLVAMFHAHQAGGPLLQDVLLLHVDGLYFRAGLQWRVEVMWTLVSRH